jgi:hypothetical protein
MNIFAAATSNKILKGLILVFLFALCLISGGVLMYLFQVDYRVLDFTLRSHFPNLYENHETARLGITPFRLSLLQFTSGLLTLTSGAGLHYLSRNYNRWSRALKIWLADLRPSSRRLISEIRRIPAGQRYASGSILLASLIANLYRSNQANYIGDEAYSYVYFIHNGFLSSLCHYPDTNNHVFFSLIGVLLDSFMQSPAWVLRLPSVLAHFLLLSLLFLFLQRHFGFRPALIALAMGACWLPSSLYAAYGRGHMLMCLFALLAAFSMYTYTIHQGRHLDRFIAASILAFYTVPTYIHLFVSFCAFGLFEGIRQRNKRLVWEVIKAGLGTALGTVILYWPIILFSGIESLLANKWVHYEAQRFGSILIVSVIETIHYILGTPAKGYWLAVAMALPFTYALWKTNRVRATSSPSQSLFDENVAHWLRLMVITVIVTAAIILLHRVYPPYRVWTYFAFLCQITLAILLEYYLKIAAIRVSSVANTVLTTLGCGIIVFIGILQYQRMESLPESIEIRKVYEARKKVNSYIISRQPRALLIEDTDAYFYYFLPLQQIIAQQTFRIDLMERPQWQSPYDFVICEPENFPQQLAIVDFHPLFQINETVVYERK